MINEIGNSNNSEISRKRSYGAIAAIILFVVIAVIIIWLSVFKENNQVDAKNATFMAKRGPLTISVLESGTIKAREQVILKNEVEGRSSIISIIPEGTRVKEGDLLVELDVSALADSRIDQEIRVQNAEAAFINATETYAVVQNQAESDLDVAKLTLDFAEQDLVQYKEGQYPNQKTAAENDITLRQEEFSRAEDTLEWSLKLFEKKFISNTELQADQLSLSRSKNNLELAQNNLRLLQEFTYHRRIAQLESDVRQAKMALERTERKARADVIQARAQLNARDLEFKRQKDKLKKIENQISKGRITAPANGMAIYATSARRGGWRDNREPLNVGVEVRERQELIYLPIASSSMAEVDIHEGSLEKVKVGLPAIITVDALQGRKFVGSVGRIAPLPDPQSMWMNPDLKVYNADIYLEDNETTLRTGMSCRVEIIVEQYEDVVFVPVQSVIRVAGQPTVFIVKNGTIQEQKVEIGMDNNRMVHITSGLQEGVAVMLTPPLKSAAIEAGSRARESGPPEDIDPLRQRINEKLEETNGSRPLRPGKPSDNSSGAPQRRSKPPKRSGRESMNE